MTTKFTNDGIMVRNGAVIAENVGAELHYNGECNFLSLSYFDERGIFNKTCESVHDYTMMVDGTTKTINGILPKNEDWYLFWNNDKKVSVFGI
jgi:hypothetical protein